MTAPPTPSALNSALEHHARHARNPSSLVALDGHTHLFEHPAHAGGVPYCEVGPVWMAGEPLAPPDALPGLTLAFRRAARHARRVPVFAPAGPQLRAAARTLGWTSVHMGTTPYLDPRHWAPRGNRGARLRNDLNHAARHGVTVHEVPPGDDPMHAAIRRLGTRWTRSRRAGTDLDWIFRLDPARHGSLKRTFVACGPGGALLAFLSASPLPGRHGWYLEDVVRGARSPRGTAATLVAHAIRVFGAGGAQSVTLGGVPLSGSAGDLHLRFLRRPLSRWYNFDGLRHFKAQFGPATWEDEWLLVPSPGALPLAAWAVARLTLPGGLKPLAQQLWTPPRQGTRPRRSVPVTT